jgi:phosphatidylserine/phosphatidylglycerophosphate/cardiolipin synthase-like enzyme
MTESFIKLSNTDLQSLIAGLRSRRIAAPYTELQLSRILAPGLIQTVAAGLSEFESLGFTSDQIEAVLELLVKDRNAGRTTESQIDLVTSGPEAPGISNRDTSVVVRELFAHAQKSVLLVGYAIYQGQQVFEALAKRMKENANLEVKLFLNISRPDQDTTASEILVSRYTQRFKDKQWPSGCRLPEVYYDPRSVADDEPVRSSLHAKCVVVDAERVFVSSANFTEAGQQRNIEVGLNIHSEWLAKRLIRHFKLLHEHGLAERAF